jgi:hypothetical protein
MYSIMLVSAVVALYTPPMKRTRALLGSISSLVLALAQAQPVQPATILATPSLSPEPVQMLIGGGGVVPPGANCDGATDDTAAIQAALNTYPNVSLPNATCYIASAITVPDFATFTGSSFQPNTAATQGTVLLCNAAIAGPCVIAGNGQSHSVVVKDMTIARGAGTIPANGECFDSPGAVYLLVERVECYNHAQGFQVDNGGPNGAIYNYFSDIHTCRISDAHVIVNGPAQIYFGNHSGLGCDITNLNRPPNGADVNSNDYVRFIGNWDTSKGTVHFTDVQFNQGNAVVGCWLDFKNFTGTQNEIGDVEVIGGHVEVVQNGICTDSTVTQIFQLQIIGVYLQGGWGGANQFYSLSATTKPFFWTLAGDNFVSWNFDMASPLGYDDVRIVGSSFELTPLSITAGANSNLTLEGNAYYGLTLSGNFNVALKVSGTSRGGSYIYNATGIVAIDIPDASLSNCTLALQFGGSSDGITYATNTCQYQLQGSRVTLAFNMALSSTGSATGNASIAGLPLNANKNAQAVTTPIMENATGLCTTTGTCGVYLATSPATTNMNFYTLGAGGQTPLTNANFSNSTTIQGTMTYLLSN